MNYYLLTSEYYLLRNRNSGEIKLITQTLIIRKTEQEGVLKDYNIDEIYFSLNR